MRKIEFNRKMHRAIESIYLDNDYSCHILNEAFGRYKTEYNSLICRMYKTMFTRSYKCSWLDGALAPRDGYDTLQQHRINMLIQLKEIALI
jgi:hypothetical protein